MKHEDVVKQIAIRCVAEGKAAGHKGRKLDQFAFDFVCGAIHAAQIFGYEGSLGGLALLAGSRGFKAIEEMADK